MGNHIFNDSFNLNELQISSLSCSPRYYSNEVKRSGSQSGYIFKDINAYFTADLEGGILRFATSSENYANTVSASVLEVIDTQTLLLDISQEISYVDYIISYGGVQASQRGTLSASAILLNGKPIGEIFRANILLETTPTVYVPRETTTYLRILAIGGGGGGGGYVDTLKSAGGGGGAGAYAEYIGRADAFTYQCGAGGQGQVGGLGGDGGETSITGSSIIGTITLPGGNGGFFATTIDASCMGLGGLGGVPTGGTTSSHGRTGDAGWLSIPALVGQGGAGADSQFGFGGASVTAISGSPTTSVGLDGIGYGAGGSGAISFDGGGGTGSGGFGKQGAIFVYEF